MKHKEVSPRDGFYKVLICHYRILTDISVCVNQTYDNLPISYAYRYFSIETTMDEEGFSVNIAQ